MAVDLTQDPSTLSEKEQHRMRAQLLREGQRSLAYNKITDYVNATPTFKPVPKKRKSRAKVKPTVMDAIDQTILDGYSSIHQPLPEYFPGGEPFVPKTAKTKADLILRVNANLQ